jgi:hypothetical protein
MDADTDDSGSPNVGLKRKRGGSRQQVAKAQDKERAERTVQSQLFLFLIHSWSWGLMPATLVQQIALLAVEDIENERKGVLNCGELRKLSKLGYYGKAKYQCNADLLKLADSIDAPVFPNPKQLELPIKDKGEPGYKLAHQGIYWPHEILAHLYHKAPSFFRQNICSGTGAIKEFWRAMRGHPMLESHPMKGEAQWEQKFIPIAVHGDGVPITGIGRSWSKSMDIWSWSSCLVSTPTLLSHFLIIGLYSLMLSKIPEGMTEEVFYKALMWSLLWAYRGKWPDTDWLGGTELIDMNMAGKDLAGGFCLVLWILRADLDFYAKSLKLPHYASNEPCPFCPANCFGGHLSIPWNDFRRGIALWLGMLYKSEEWRALFPDHNPLFDLPGVTHNVIACDTMHTKHMGTDMWFLGSVLHYLCYWVMPGLADTS